MTWLAYISLLGLSSDGFYVTGYPYPNQKPKAIGEHKQKKQIQ